MAKKLPHLCGNVGNHGRKEQNGRLKGLPHNLPKPFGLLHIFILKQGGNLVYKLHDAAYGSVEVVPVLYVLADLFYGLVRLLPESLKILVLGADGAQFIPGKGGTFKLLEVVCNKAPEPMDKPVGTFHAPVAPLKVPFRGGCKEDKEPYGVGPVAFYHGVRVHHVSLGL